MTRQLNLDPPLVNASGIFSFVDVLERLEKEGVALGGFVTKSIGPVEREGNENPVIAREGDLLLNSLALPCQPPDQWVEEFRATTISRPIVASVYGFCLEDWFSMVRTLEPYVAGFELNLSCPNRMPGEESLMVLLANNPELVEEVVAALRAVTEKPIIAKLSPNTDYLSVAGAAYRAGADYIACANSLGPGLSIDIWKQKPILAGITGGVTGPALKPVSMMMVYRVFQTYPIPVIAYGGVSRWEDVVEYSLAGASIVGLGSCFAGKTTAQAVEFTRQLWRGVEAFLDGRQFSEIVGAAHAR